MSAGPNLCKSCGAPIAAGAHRWAGREPEEHWHYSCAEKASLTGRRRPVPRASGGGLPAAAPLIFTHDRVWAAIEALARQSGASLSALATRAGLDPTSLNRSKRVGADGKPRWPSSRTIAQLLQATGTSFRSFCSLVEPPDQPIAGEARADILLVDDSAEIRDSYGAVLRSAGYRVHAASCHREVLDLLDRAQPVDLLCTDIVMPEGLGGVGLARLVRARRPALHILYITGYDIPSISGQRELHVMRKPVPPETLLEAVEQALTAPPAPLSRTHSLGR